MTTLEASPEKKPNPAEEKESIQSLKTLSNVSTTISERRLWEYPHPTTFVGKQYSCTTSFQAAAYSFAKASPTTP